MPGGRGEVLAEGASGLGSRLSLALTKTGPAWPRSQATPPPATAPVRLSAVPCTTRPPLSTALAGCQAACYLVRSVSHPDFPRKNAGAAEALGEAVARADLPRIIDPAGLSDGADALPGTPAQPPRGREAARCGRVPVSVLRAGIHVGHGGISREPMRQLVEHLPMMVTPKRVSTRTQPIAVDDAARYHAGVPALPEAPGRASDIGGPVLQYVTMLRRVAVVPASLLSLRVAAP